jgi:uncharacterized protein DUF4365
LSFDDSRPDLGPLPVSDNNAELQRESIKALNALLKGQDNVIFRDERVEDYGVDGSFELKLHGRMTNFRGQVQMKASGHLAPLKNGSVSFPVRTANLNYLLNGTAPIYILYDSNKDEFWYAWAQDESHRLEAENWAWREQDSITLRFTEPFTKQTLASVYERILRDGRLHREVHDSLARATGREPIVISIDASSLKITDPTRARDVLLASGTAIVAAGFPREALNLICLLDSDMRDTPRIQLTAGYAEFTIGDHYAALGHIRRALARRDELGARDQSFLGTLKNASEFHVGLIDAARYQQRITERSQMLTGLEAVEARQDALYHQCAAENDPDLRSALAEKLRNVTEEILRHSDADRAVKLDARLLLLYVEGMQANLAATQKLISADIRSFLFPGDLNSIVQNLQDAKGNYLRWEKQSEEALREAYELRHPVLIVQALTIALNVRIGRLMDERLEAMNRDESYVVRDAVKASIQRSFDEALQLCELSGSVERRLTLKKLEADFLEIQGDLPGAKALAEKLYPEADAMGFKIIAEKAREILEDRTMLMRYEQERARSDREDPDLMRANQTDAQLARIARQLQQVVGSPPAHPKKLLGYVRSLRIIAQERRRWCRHIQLLEDLTQTTNPFGAFSTTPMRKCLCDRFGYKSVGESVDVVAIIADFKLAYCDGCSARNPKG